jgi:hypothetical protein
MKPRATLGSRPACQAAPMCQSPLTPSLAHLSVPLFFPNCWRAARLESATVNLARLRCDKCLTWPLCPPSARALPWHNFWCWLAHSHACYHRAPSLATAMTHPVPWADKEHSDKLATSTSSPFRVAAWTNQCPPQLPRHFLVGCRSGVHLTPHAGHPTSCVPTTPSKRALYKALT